MAGVSFETALALTHDENYSSYLSETENERFFKFQTEIGKYYVFQTRSDYDLMAYAYDANFYEFAFNDDGGDVYNPLIGFKATSNISYFKVQAYNTPNGQLNFQAHIKEGVPIRHVRCVAIPIYGYGSTPPPEPLPV